MSESQSAILPEAGSSALFLILKVQGIADAIYIAKGLAAAPQLTRELSARFPEAVITSAIGIGFELWNRLSPTNRPAGFRPFRAIEAGARSAPATGGDILLHIHSNRQDLNFELGSRVRRRFGDEIDVLDEVHGFRYLDARDLTGFLDGTENPQGAARAEVALIGAEQPRFAGGSFAYVQRYVHDLERWTKLTIIEQEKIIGRRKPDSADLPDREKPATAHIRRATLEENGEELKIVRHSFPYGTTSSAGLLFIAYTRDLSIPERILHRLMGSSGDGLHDRLMDFTQAVSGAHFFVPSLEVLDSLANG